MSGLFSFDVHRLTLSTKKWIVAIFRCTICVSSHILNFELNYNVCHSILKILLKLCVFVIQVFMFKLYSINSMERNLLFVVLSVVVIIFQIFMGIVVYFTYHEAKELNSTSTESLGTKYFVYF